jgi:ureidoglycolate hydrolase
MSGTTSYSKSELPIIDATAAEMAGIGTILRLPDRAERSPDVENEVIRYFGKLGVIESAGAVEFGICAFSHRPFVVERLEQHRRSCELLYAIHEDFIMPVAPNDPTIDQPDLSKAFAIRVRRSQGVIFAPGAWHWVPYPLKGESFALVGFALDTPKNDMFFHDVNPKLKILI